MAGSSATNDASRSNNCKQSRRDQHRAEPKEQELRCLQPQQTWTQRSNPERGCMVVFVCASGFRGNVFGGW